MSRDWQQYRIQFLPCAEKALKKLAKKLGRPMFDQLRTAILDLKHDPLGKTDPLYGKLQGLRSMHCSRCRVIVQVNNSLVLITVVGAGWRTDGDRIDIYKQVGRAIELGEIDLKDLNEPEDISNN